MTVVSKSAREVAVEFMLQQGRHFCENSYCTCIDRLTEVIQWERSVGAIAGAAAERERIAAESKPTIAKARRFSSREATSQVRKAL